MGDHGYALWPVVALLVLLAPFLPLSALGLTLGRVLAQGADSLNITQYRLDNGLNVILVEDHSAPTAAVSVWYKVGGANDPPGRSGFAHLFEHMMFQGSANVPPGRHSELINNAGGEDNASTGIDRTNYFEVLSANQLPLALWLEADRMASLVVDDANFAREREVVKEEYRQRIENQAYGEAMLRLQTLPFDYPPYKRPVIGAIPDLDQATGDEVRAFHAAYYKPNNATLTVAGDIDVAQARELIQEYFGAIARQPEPPPLPPYTFTIQTQPHIETIRDKLARVPATFIAYRIPPRGQPDYYPAVLLARILGEGDSSRLARALVDTGLASSVSVYTSGNLGPSVFYVTLVPNPGVEVSRLEELYYQELERIRTQGVTPEELAKAINQIRTQRIRNLQTALGLAESVQSANFYLGDPHAVFSEIERFRAVTPADVQRVAREYLGQSSRNVITVVPMAERVTPPPTEVAVEATPVVTGTGAAVSAEVKETEGTVTMPTGTESATQVASTSTPTATVTAAVPISATAEVSRSATAVLPTPLPVRSFSLPPITQTRLDNGLQVIVIPLHNLPLLTVRVVFPGGESGVPVQLAGLAEFTVHLLTRGTQKRSAQEIASAIEQVGGELTTDANNDQMHVTVTALKDYANIAFGLLSDVVLNPTFPEDEVENQRKRMLTNLEATLADPAEVASRTFNAILYGAHPYGRPVTEASLKAITREDILAFYRVQRNPQDAILVVAGDITPEEAVTQAKASFSAWAAEGPARANAFPMPPQRAARTVYLVDRPGSTQVQLMVGHLGLKGASPERYALQVANQVLGGGATSRLFRNLREQRGYTYGVYSGFTFPRDIGKFAVQAAVRNEVIVPAVQQILLEIERMQTSPVPADELANAKNYLVGSFALRLETMEALVGQVVDLRLRGLPIEVLKDYPRNIEMVDESEVNRVAREYLHPDKAAIVVVGDASKIRSDLAQIGPVVPVNSEGQVQQ